MKLLNQLPGIPLPVSDVTRELTNMWRGEGVGGHGASEEFYALQMNLILHFGRQTTGPEAQAQFDIAIQFAQRYPCRIIVLCPAEEPHGDELLQGKLFSQCYVGRGLRAMCCCEALMLSYPVGEPDYLDDQVSIWLDSDLPVYHWFHRMSAERVRDHYLGFAKKQNRVVFDSNVTDPKLANLDWGVDGFVHDLAYARTLPVRQSMGTFLSAYSPETLCAELRKVEIAYSADEEGEARAIAAWLRRCLSKCSDCEDDATHMRFSIDPLDDGSRFSMEIEWEYANGNFFSWSHREKSGTALIRANLGAGQVSHPMQVRFLEPAEALAEALFFNQ